MPDVRTYGFGETTFRGGRHAGNIAVQCPLCHEDITIPVLVHSILFSNNKGTAEISINSGLDEVVHDCSFDPAT